MVFTIIITRLGLGYTLTDLSERITTAAAARSRRASCDKRLQEERSLADVESAGSCV